MELNLTRRQMIIIGAVIVLLIIIIAILSMMGKPDTAEEVFVPQVYDANNLDPSVANKEMKQMNDKEMEARALSRNFVARFLSYSNENWGENIDVLESQMTESMMQYAQRELLQLKSDHPVDEFYGVSAKVLSQSVVEESGDYIMNLDVQLQKTIGNDEEIEYLSYKVDLVESGDSWLINSMYLVE